MRRFLFFFLVVLSPMMAALNDIFPTDYVANKPGDSFVAAYFKESSSDGYYKNGSRLLNDSLSVSARAVRLGYATELFNRTTSFAVVGSYAKAVFDGPVVEAIYPQTTSGMGDVRLAVSSFLINKPSEMEYLAITPIVFFPTGKYDSSRAFNIGENRYKATLGGGYVNRFMNNDFGELFLELSPELAFYGDNNDARGKRLKQAPSYALTGYLRYRPVPIFSLFGGYQINRGGETTLDGAKQNDQANNTRLMMGGSIFLYGTQIIFRHARDVAIHTGFKTDKETTIRLQWSFKK